jgi:hypothetical protein
MHAEKEVAEHRSDGFASSTQNLMVPMQLGFRLCHSLRCHLWYRPLRFLVLASYMTKLLLRWVLTAQNEREGIIDK